MSLNWFANQDINQIENIELSKRSDFQLNEILNEQFLWNQENKITFTSAIIINGYHFHKEYDRGDLIHLINDLENDEDFR